MEDKPTLDECCCIELLASCAFWEASSDASCARLARSENDADHIFCCSQMELMMMELMVLQWAMGNEWAMDVNVDGLWFGVWRDNNQTG